MKNIIAIWLFALVYSLSAQTGSDTKILYQFKDALWEQTSTLAKDSGSPGTSNGTISATDINQVTFKNNGSGGTAIDYSITSANAKIAGVTADWGEKFVLEARIKKSAVTGADSDIYIIKNATTGLSWYINTDTNGDKKMVLQVGTGTSIKAISELSVVADDTWVTLAVVIDFTQTALDDAIKFFVNENLPEPGEEPQGPAPETESYTGYSLEDFELEKHTAATSGTGTVSSSSILSSYYDWEAFDKIRDTYLNSWRPETGQYPHWLKYIMKKPDYAGKKLIGYTIVSRSDDHNGPKDWVLKVDDDDNIVDRRAGVFFAQGEVKSFYLKTPVTVNDYFEFNITAINEGHDFTNFNEVDLIWVEEELRTKVLQSVDITTNIVPELTSNNDQGYTVTATQFQSTYEPYKAFEDSTNKNWCATTSAGVDQSLTILFPSPKNVSAVRIEGSYHMTYPNSKLPNGLKIYVIKQDDSERLVYQGGFEKEKLYSFYSPEDVKGVKLTISEDANSGLGRIRIFSGTYATGQPQKPYINTQIPENEGAIIGNMTSDGGIATAFNGTIEAASTGSAGLTPSTGSFIGKSYTATKMISQVYLHSPDDGYFPAGTYQVQISDDFTNWVTVYDGISPIDIREKILAKFKPVSTAHIRVLFTGDTNAGYVAEMEVFEALNPDSTAYLPLTSPLGYGNSEKNSQKDAVATASPENSSYTPDKAIDGDIATYYRSATPYGWLKVTYPVEKTFSSFFLRQSSGTSYRTDSVNVFIDDVLKETLSGLNQEEGIYQLSTTYVGKSIKIETVDIPANTWYVDEFYTFGGQPYYELAPLADPNLQTNQIALDTSSVYTSGVYASFSGENAIELLQKDGGTGSYSLQADFIKMTLNRSVGTFDVANFQGSEGYKVDSNYNLTGTTNSSVYIYPPKLLRRVNNKPADFDDKGQPKEGVTVDIDNGSGNKVFYGMFQFEYALNKELSENVTIDVYMKTNTFNFKKIAEISPVAKPSDPAAPWVNRYYWNSRITQFDWDGNAYKTTGAVQFKFEVR